MTVIFFLFSVMSVWHGFSIGGASGFLYLMGGVVLALFGVASAGMGVPDRSSNRPPSRPPGYRNKVGK